MVRSWDGSPGTGVGIGDGILEPRGLGIAFSARVDNDREHIGVTVGEGGWGPGGVSGPRRLTAVMSTMYDFVERHNFTTSSASASAFVTRFPFGFLCARRLRLGFSSLDASGDRMEAHTVIESVIPRLVL